MELGGCGRTLDLFHAVAQELACMESNGLVVIASRLALERGGDVAGIAADGEQSGGRPARLVTFQRMDAVASHHRALRERHCRCVDSERLAVHGSRPSLLSW